MNNRLLGVYGIFLWINFLGNRHFDKGLCFFQGSLSKTADRYYSKRYGFFNFLYLFGFQTIQNLDLTPFAWFISSVL